jgi:hypothetical protein
MPPTTAVMTPSIAGMPEATAIPIDRGRAIKKSTTDGGMSFTIPSSFSFRDAILDPLVPTLAASGPYNMVARV